MDRQDILKRAEVLEEQARNCPQLIDAQRLAFEADRLRASATPVAATHFLPVFRN